MVLPIKSDIRMCGVRALTILIVLNTNFESGGTGFPRAGSLVAAEEPCKRRNMRSCFPASSAEQQCNQGLVVDWQQAGQAVSWWNHLDDGTQDPHAIHSGCNVSSGDKWILSMWLQLTDEVITAIEQWRRDGQSTQS